MKQVRIAELKARGTLPLNRVPVPKRAKLSVDVVQLLLEERQGHR